MAVIIKSFLRGETAGHPQLITTHVTGTSPATMCAAGGYVPLQEADDAVRVAQYATAVRETSHRVANGAAKLEFTFGSGGASADAPPRSAMVVYQSSAMSSSHGRHILGGGAWSPSTRAPGVEAAPRNLMLPDLNERPRIASARLREGRRTSGGKQSAAAGRRRTEATSSSTTAESREPLSDCSPTSSDSREASATSNRGEKSSTATTTRTGKITVAEKGKRHGAASQGVTLLHSPSDSGPWPLSSDADGTQFDFSSAPRLVSANVDTAPCSGRATRDFIYRSSRSQLLDGISFEPLSTHPLKEPPSAFEAAIGKFDTGGTDHASNFNVAHEYRLANKDDDFSVFIREARKHLSKDPTDLKTLLYLARASVKSDELIPAERYLESALSIMKVKNNVKQVKNSEKGKLSADTNQSREVDLGFTLNFFRGHIAYGERRYADACDCLALVCKERPAHQRAKKILADAFFLRGREHYGRAVHLYEELVAVAPQGGGGRRSRFIAAEEGSDFAGMSMSELIGRSDDEMDSDGLAAALTDEEVVECLLKVSDAKCCSDSPDIKAALKQLKRAVRIIPRQPRVLCALIELEQDTAPIDVIDLYCLKLRDTLPPIPPHSCDSFLFPQEKGSGSPKTRNMHAGIAREQQPAATNHTAVVTDLLCPTAYVNDWQLYFKATLMVARNCSFHEEQALALKYLSEAHAILKRTAALGGSTSTATVDTPAYWTLRTGKQDACVYELHKIAAQTCSAVGEHSAARRHADLGLSIKSGCLECHVVIADAAVAEGLWSTARREYKTVVQILSECQLAKRCRESQSTDQGTAGGLGGATNSRRASRVEDQERLVLAMEKLLEVCEHDAVRDLAEQEVCLTFLCEARPKDAHLRYKLAMCQRAQQKSSMEAEENLRVALQLQPLHSKTIAALIEIETARMNWAECVALCARVESHRSTDSKFLDEFAAASLKLIPPNIDEALRLSRAVITLAPLHVRALYRIATIFVEYKKDLSQGKAFMHRVLTAARSVMSRSNCPSSEAHEVRQLHDEALLVLAELYLPSDEEGMQLAIAAERPPPSSTALKYSSQAAKSSIAKLRAQLVGGCISFRLGDFDKAAQLLQSALTLAKISSDKLALVQALATLSLVSGRRGNTKKALDLAREGAELTPANPSVAVAEAMAELSVIRDASEVVAGSIAVTKCELALSLDPGLQSAKLLEGYVKVFSNSQTDARLRLEAFIARQLYAKEELATSGPSAGEEIADRLWSCRSRLGAAHLYLAISKQLAKSDELQSRRVQMATIVASTTETACERFDLDSGAKSCLLDAVLVCPHLQKMWQLLREELKRRGTALPLAFVVDSFVKTPPVYVHETHVELLARIVRASLHDEFHELLVRTKKSSPSKAPPSLDCTGVTTVPPSTWHHHPRHDADVSPATTISSPQKSYISRHRRHESRRAPRQPSQPRTSLPSFESELRQHRPTSQNFPLRFPQNPLDPRLFYPPQGGGIPSVARQPTAPPSSPSPSPQHFYQHQHQHFVHPHPHHQYPPGQHHVHHPFAHRQPHQQKSCTPSSPRAAHHCWQKQQHYERQHLHRQGRVVKQVSSLTGTSVDGHVVLQPGKSEGYSVLGDVEQREIPSGRPTKPSGAQLPPPGPRRYTTAPPTRYQGPTASSPKSSGGVSLRADKIMSFADFKYSKKLGSGAFGTVYAATHLPTGMHVAVKELHASALTLSMRQWRDLSKELESIQSLSHPSLVKFVGAVLGPEKFCVVTELCANGSLHGHLHTSRTALSFAHRKAIALSICAGVAHLHSLQPVVIHRDLKSLNVVLDGNWKAKICDFGLTTCIDVGHTHLSLPQNQHGGSPRYMAPECWDNGKLTEKVDVWAMGCIFIELFGGGVPFGDCTKVEHIMTRLFVQKRGPTISSGIPELVRGVIRGCLEFDVKIRSTAAQVLSAIERV